jgi:hypothetical protein
MSRVLAVIVASIFAFGAASGLAQTAAKKEDLTKEERAEMRNRADRLVAERASGVTPAKASADAPAKAPTTSPAKKNVKKKKAPKGDVKPAQPKA